MKKKIIRRYLIIGIPFMIGTLLFSIGIINILSSLLLFCGGYILFKNIFDYRKIHRNKFRVGKKVNISNIDKDMNIDKDNINRNKTLDNASSKDIVNTSSNGKNIDMDYNREESRILLPLGYINGKEKNKNDNLDTSKRLIKVRKKIK